MNNQVFKTVLADLAGQADVQTAASQDMGDLTTANFEHTSTSQYSAQGANFQMQRQEIIMTRYTQSLWRA